MPVLALVLVIALDTALLGCTGSSGGDRGRDRESRTAWADKACGPLRYAAVRD